MSQESEWDEFENEVLTNLLPKLRDSAITMALNPRGEPDVKMAVELGMSLLLDKPIILVSEVDQEIPEALRRAALEVVTIEDLRSSEGAKKLAAVVQQIITKGEPDEDSDSEHPRLDGADSGAS